MRIRLWLISAALASLTAISAFSQNTPARFSLEVGDKEMGKAQYQFLTRKDGFAVKGSYSFSVGAIHAECTREGELGPQYELKTDLLNMRVSGGTQEARFTAHPKDSQFMFEAHSRGDVVDHSFPFYPRTVVLNDFDPSGVQGLLYLAATQPAGTQDYWVLVAKGHGIQSSAQLVAAAGGEGLLDGTKISLKHWQLTVGAVVMDIWADQQNLLMEAAVASQALAYRREGFTLKTPSADSNPTAPSTNAADDGLGRHDASGSSMIGLGL